MIQKRGRRFAAGIGSRMRYLNMSMTALQAIVAVGLGVRLDGMGILPGRYMFAYIMTMTAVIVLCCLAAGKKGLGPAVLLVSALCTGALVYVSAAVNKLDRTLQNISTETLEPDTQTDVEPDRVPVPDAAEEAGAEEAGQLPSEEKAFVIYISGIDTFGSLDGKSRSDVNILLALNMETGHIQLVGTPRDYYVVLPDKGAADKLTHAGLYGVECSRSALENLYGITIDYCLKVNFSGFEEIIDFLGGVDVYSEYDFSVEPVKHYTVGYNHLSGIEALAFARERYSFAAGDIQRSANQMEVVRAVIFKLLSVDMLLNYSEILDEISENFQTDMTPQVIYDLARYQLSGHVTWQVDSFTVKGTGSRRTTYSMPDTASYVMIPDEADVAEAKRLIEAVLGGK